MATRSRVVLCLGVFAALALGVQPASAASFHFEAEEKETVTEFTAAAKSAQVFKTEPENEWAIECQEVSVEGTAEGEAAEEITVHPEYKSCFYEPGHVIAYVWFGECAYRLTSETGESEHAGTVVECPEEGETEVIISVTTIKLGCTRFSGQGAYATHYTSTENGGGSSRDIDVSATFSGMEFETRSGCGELGEIDYSGTYNGDFTLSGDSPLLEGPTGIWWE